MLPRWARTVLFTLVAVVGILLVRHLVHESEARANQRIQSAISACIRREQAASSSGHVSALTIEKCKKEVGVA